MTPFVTLFATLMALVCFFWSAISMAIAIYDTRDAESHTRSERTAIGWAIATALFLLVVK